MSDLSQGPGWWQASDGKWYSPEKHPGYRPPPPPIAPPPPGGQGPDVNGPVTYLQRAQTNGYAIASMVLGILWLYFVGSILALVFGDRARKEINASNGAQQGQGMATAGIVLGWIGMALLIPILLIVAIRVLGQQADSSFSSTGSAIN